MTLLVDVAVTSAEVAALSSRLAKRKKLASMLEKAGAEDIAAVVAWLSGELLQRRIGVGWAALSEVPPAAIAPSLTVQAVNEAFAAMAEGSGPGSQTARLSALRE